MKGQSGNSTSRTVQDCTDEAAMELATVLNGIITGEGPTTQGRIHFSRTLDSEDAMLCERILMAAGRDGAAVSRAEAEMLFDIDAAATERTDQGRFDDLFAKAVAHYVLAAAGHEVPPREIALAPETPLSSWAPKKLNGSVDSEIQVWMTSHLNNRKRLSRALATIAVLICGAAVSPVAQSIAGLLDLSA
ncbi:MAG: hypothetical protein J2P54_23840 [Bradyrhizobiaceae bacterium]|nr:hypothetical protein [Bradyrhizobiaceae bacterium]